MNIKNTLLEKCEPCQPDCAEVVRVAREAVKLKEWLGDHWGEYANHTIAEWKEEVCEESTRQGYWEWVVSKIEEK